MGGKKRLVFGVIVLVLLAAANRLWFILNLPLMAEEQEMLNSFVSSGIGTALTDYSSPHNHVLHAMITALLAADGTVMRLIAMVASLASALVVFRLVLREQSARFAFFSAAVWMASLGALLSGSLGRGHALVTLFALTAYYAYQRIDADAGRIGRWSVVFVVACGLGFLSVPTFALPFVAFVVSVVAQYLIHRNRELLVRHGINLALGLALGVLFYLPILLENPLPALTDNWVIREYDLANFTVAGVADHARSVLASMDPLVAGLFIPFALIAIWLQKEWNGPFMSQAIIMVLVSLCYVGLYGNLPPVQTLVFMVPFIIMAVSEGLHNGYHQVSQRYRKGMMVLIALLPILVLINSNKAMYRIALPSETVESAPLPTIESPSLQETE